MSTFIAIFITAIFAWALGRSILLWALFAWWLPWWSFVILLFVGKKKEPKVPNLPPILLAWYGKRLTEKTIKRMEEDFKDS
jgi:hypothetical protein